MPLAQPGGSRNWGYDGVLPFAPQYAYGTPDELKAFVDAAHARGLSVLLDVVYNHFGPEGNYLAQYAAPFFTTRHHTPWGAAINVDGPGSETVRELFVQNALFWLREYRFDGLRLDAVHEIRDESPRPFLAELVARVRVGVEPGRHIHLVLENDANRAQLLTAYDAQWNDDAHHAFHVLTTGETDGYYRDFARAPARLLGRALAEGFAFQGEASEHRGGTLRGEPSAALPATAFVDFLQNHDQIGNRALGERISALAPEAAVRAVSDLIVVLQEVDERGRRKGRARLAAQRPAAMLRGFALEGEPLGERAPEQPRRRAREVAIVPVGLVGRQDMERVVRVVVPLRVVGGQELGSVRVVLEHEMDVTARFDADAHARDELGQERPGRFVANLVHRVEPQPVEAVLAQPEQRVLHEQLADGLGPRPVNVDRRTPRRVMPRREERRGVLRQIVSLRPEVVVDDVQQHAQPARVRGVDERLELIGRAVGVLRGEWEHAVVAPVARTARLRQRHQLDRGHARNDSH